MIRSVWSVDGYDWNIPCNVERESEMTASEISGLMLDRSYFNDVLGTYMVYDIKVDIPLGKEGEFSQLYKILTDPVHGHEFVLPFDSGIKTFVGRVENVKDVFTRMRDGSNRWSGITFQIKANHPSKWPTLEDAIASRGEPPLPDEADVDVGAVYMYTADGWTEAPSGDNTEY